MAGFSEKEQALVKSSWEDITKNFSHHSIRFYTLLLEILPAAKEMFPFLKDSNDVPKNNPQLEAQAMKVFKLVGMDPVPSFSILTSISTLSRRLGNQRRTSYFTMANQTRTNICMVNVVICGSSDS